VAKQIALLGFGDILNRVFSRISSLYPSIITLSRDTKKHPKNAISITADLLSENPINWPYIPDIVVYTPVPTEASIEGYQQGYINTTNSLLSQLPQTTHIILVSSTRVFNKLLSSSPISDESIDFSTEPKAAALRSMEQALEARDGPYTILRPSGIYGRSDKRYLKLLESEETSTTFGNRIHADDLAGFISFLIGQIVHSETVLSHYTVTDNHPASSGEIISYLKNKPLTDGEGVKIEGLRYKNSGYKPLHSSYRSGLAHLKQPLHHPPR